MLKEDKSIWSMQLRHENKLNNKDITDAIVPCESKNF